MNYIKKLIQIFNVVPTKEVEGAEVYVVSWTARWGDYYGETSRVFKAFLLEDDANEFKQSLIDAHKLLQNTTSINVKVEKQS